MPHINAAILIIGNEILSGATQDANIAYISKRLGQRGISVMEVRIVRDDEDAIIEAVNALRKRYTYVFTTGGIGPTHDDITAPAMAKAFKVDYVVAQEAKKRLEDYYAGSQTEINEARMRMATVPAGALLIDNPVSAAPGFALENVFVMAGVPKIMQAMFDHVDTMIEGGPILMSQTVSCNLREGDIGKELSEIQAQFPDIDVGSYPHMYQNPSLSIVIRGADENQVLRATQKVRELINAKGEKPAI